MGEIGLRYACPWHARVARRCGFARQQLKTRLTRRRAARRRRHAALTTGFAGAARQRSRQAPHYIEAPAARKPETAPVSSPPGTPRMEKSAAREPGLFFSKSSPQADATPRRFLGRKVLHEQRPRPPIYLLGQALTGVLRLPRSADMPGRYRPAKFASERQGSASALGLPMSIFRLPDAHFGRISHGRLAYSAGRDISPSQRKAGAANIGYIFISAAHVITRYT